jgi:hypothetical protein
MKFVFWIWKEHPDFVVTESLDTSNISLVETLKKYEIPYVECRNLEHRDQQFKIFCQSVYNDKIVYFVPEECRLFLPGYLNEIYQILDCNNSTLEIWLGNFDEEQGVKTIGIELPNDRISVVNWNTFLMYESYDYYNRVHLKVDNVEIDKAYTYLNNRITYHRCMMIDALAKHDLIKDGYVSWHKALDDNIYNDVFQYFDNEKIFLNNTPAPHKFHKTVHEMEYFKGFVNIISEGEVMLKDISEKTFYAILHKKPFLILGAPGIHAELTKLGFRLFDTVFDYSFDRCENFNDRIDGIIANVKKILNSDYNSLKSKVDDVLDYNYNRYIEILKDKNSIPALFWEYCNIVDISKHEKENLNFYFDLCKNLNVGRPNCFQYIPETFQ